MKRKGPTKQRKRKPKVDDFVVDDDEISYVSGSDDEPDAPDVPSDDDEDLEPVYKKFKTRAVTEEELAPQRAAQAKAMAKAAKALAAAKAEMIKNREKTTPGSRQDGSFHITFLEMGQGDCIIMATPKGQIVVVDCGSLGSDEADPGDIGDDEPSLTTAMNAAHDRAYGKRYLLGYNQIDVLVLTHPDKDHYNRFRSVFKSTVKIHSIYHSLDFSRYAKDTMTTWLTNRLTTPTSKYRVDNCTIQGNIVMRLNGNKVPVAKQSDKSWLNKSDGNGGIRIVDEDDCSMSILAGGVGQENRSGATDESDARSNFASLVVLVEVFGEKILITGDATFETESFLLSDKTRKKRVADLSLIQAGHHGSERTSSGKNWVSHVNTARLAISAGWDIKKHHHPAGQVIEDYSDDMKASKRATKINKHEIAYWTKLYGGYQRETAITTWPIHITGSWGHYTYTVSPISDSSDSEDSS